MTVNLVDLYGPGANGSPVSGRNDPFAANYSTKWGLRQGRAYGSAFSSDFSAGGAFFAAFLAFLRLRMAFTMR